MDLTAEQMQLLKSWSEAKQALHYWQEEETRLRLEVIKTVFQSSEAEGSKSIELQGGWKLKATHKLDYNLNNKEGQVVALCAQIGEEWSKKLIRWSPELSVGAYKKLDPETQKVFDGFLTIKPAKPTLELVEPKKD